MLEFKISLYKIILLLSLSLMASVTWSQEETSAESIEQEAAGETTLAENEQNDTAVFTPLIFDPVLIEYIELSETGDNGANRFSTVELSSLPSTPTSSSFVKVDDAPVNLELLDSSIGQLQQRISEFDLEGGVYDYRLSELYLSVGNAYQELNEPQLAIDAFNEALQLTRINNGLFTEDQLPMVENLVETYLSLGDVPSANINQEYLFYVQQKIYGAAHPVILVELLEYADWNLHAASLSLGYAPNLQSLHFRTSSFNESLFNQSEMIEDLLTAAAFAYSQALIMQHDLESDFDGSISPAETRELKDSLSFTENDLDIAETEQKLAYTHFLQYQFDINNVAVNSYGEAPSAYFLDSDIRGRQALERRYEYLRRAGGSTLDIILALLDVADWYLFFERWTSAEEIYLQVFAMMESNGVNNIEGLRYPDLPATIPSFLSSAYTRGSNRLSPEEVLEYAGYIDVSFELSRFARPMRIRLLSSSEGTTIATERALLRKLRNTAYRRQIENQTEYSENAYTVRYYYTAQLPDEE